MDKELNDYVENFDDYTELYHYLNWLGYTTPEIKAAVAYYNLHHNVSIVNMQLPLAVGMLVQIIEGVIR